jgi:hypothetical protein
LRKKKGYLIHAEKHFALGCSSRRAFTDEFEPVYCGDEGKAYLQADALWLIPGPFMAIRLAYSLGERLEIVKTVKKNKDVNFHLASPSGKLILSKLSLLIGAS